MAQIRIEPKRVVWWPYVLWAVALIAAAWLWVERDGPANLAMDGRDRASRDSVASPPPR